MSDYSESMLSMMASMGISPQQVQQFQEIASRNPDMMRSMMAAVSGRMIPEQQHDIDTFGERMAEQIAVARASLEREKKLAPAKVPKVNRQELKFAMMQDRIVRDRQRAEVDVVRNVTTYVGMEKHVSTTPLDELRPITISGMLVRKVHKGCYLICRVFTPCNLVTSVQVGIEDTDGDVRMLSIYNYPGLMDADSMTLDTVFPCGTVLIIREPLLKMPQSGTGDAFIRVDSPSDLVFPQPGDPRLEEISWRCPLEEFPSYPTTMEAWKLLGNKHFEGKRWLAAAVIWTHGLDKFPEAWVLLLNRSASYLRLGRFSAAAADARAVLKAPNVPHNLQLKARLRIAQAAYHQEGFKEALRVVQSVSADDADNRDARAWSERVKSRIDEQSSGKYNWKKMFKESQGPEKKLDVADYAGPFRVASLPQRGGGRGLVASRDVKMGEVLVVEKAFASVYPSELPASEMKTVINLLTGGCDVRCDAANIERVINRVCGNPNIAQSLYNLYAGPSLPPPPPTYSIELPAPDANEQLCRPLEMKLAVDVRRIEGICCYNSFSPHGVGSVGFTSTAQDKHDSPSALYRLCSLINHACVGTALWVCIGDVMVVRAAQDIKQGEEITMSYVPLDPFEERKQHLSKFLDSCDCWLCDLDRTDGVECNARRLALWSGLNEQRNPTIAAARRLVQTLDATYASSRGRLRPEMWHAHHRLGQALGAQAVESHSTARDSPLAILAEFSALEACGIEVTDKSRSGAVTARMKKASPIRVDRALPFQATEACAMTALMIAGSFCALSDRVRVARWLKAARQIDGAAFGEDLFDLRYDSVIEAIGIKAFLAGI